MLLRELLAPLLVSHIKGDDQVVITGITADSRNVKPGDLFICLSGFTVDGHEFAAQAVEKGAIAIIAEHEIEVDKTVVIVPDSRRAMAFLADRFFGSPSQKLKLIGVTGTNGKTTTTHLIDRILTDQQKKTGLIGTIHMRIGDQIEKVKNTTPDMIDLQSSFRRMLDIHTDYAIMEVSSHALDMGRVHGCDYHTAIFTNMTQDHLDYHKTFDNYRQAKSLLFAQLGNSYDQQSLKTAILNADDEVSKYFAHVTPARVLTYGIDQPADVRAVSIRVTSAGTSFTVQSFAGVATVNMKLMGKFNVYNALAAIAATLVEGVPLAAIIKSLEGIPGVDGRFEPVSLGQDYAVIVDYSHTPDSLENALVTAKEFVTGQLICVAGCGGNRDRTKRPIMAQIATKYADYSVLTSDNPRFEEPEAILADMVGGIQNVDQKRFTTIVNRREAIFHAISQAKPGDCVLIAGKGHETYQESKGEIFPFDDREVAKEAIHEQKRK
ncbi:UDP-N-acetylmuramoyl-L-alanyl-D-glutamate--2,6-diaminopimelate ligase [Brevibacillus laterosporus]|uniref:UDP-N-acetylmuramoyl-L-alanyl-D-glutamate--2, 6-diaminopimelate ligase n=1 Tax=Brevibacillus laterosporus TaxID=1465 RepID=UPI0002150065|nr:UDP-N-acetylmuramoyl-L-alanyl-D-glutamate--2,6-diaminopimelate ligase [Brevibacillus laterosporus]RJL15688.1 UDP-N-acetylmuramoyl-L-alanyl-D-glutamate--2,6-diaminopimelate ligase [Brevibacillus laterosporus]TPH06147.1 UDP-N-acetylmuramoyl-L-alanyl-D-glutamate--2,6-diaminopimelate ligase [Brevibacillus laterosporus]